MALSFLDMQNRVLRLLDETSTGSPTTLALVKDFLNESHYKRCTEYPWGWMVFPKEQTLTMVAGQRVYALHELFHRPMYFRSQSTKRYLVELPQRELTAEDVDFYDTTQRTPDTFVYWGQWVVSKQPTTSSTVTIVSSSASDTSALSVIVSGVDANGIAVSETRTLNGTTSVATTQSFAEITGITKSAATTGTLTFTLTTGGDTILKLGASEFGKQYKTIFLMDAPEADEVIGYRFFRIPPTLTNDYDMPLLPAPHEMLLVYDTLVRMAGYLTETNPQTLAIWQQHQAEAQLALYQAYANEGQTYGARSQRVRLIDEPWGM